jgi:hypothetical protein
LSARLEENGDEVWTYKLIILGGDGRYQKVFVDAGRNVILKITR